MLCTIINGSLLFFWIIMLILAPDMVYRTQNRWFPIPRETFNIVMYSFLGLFKIIFLVFNLIPWVALIIVA
jgi:cell shape-determining protein MreC